MDTEHTALLLMDLQKGIVDRIDNTRLLPRIESALTAARRTGMRVIWVKVCFRHDYPEVSRSNASFAAIRETGRFTESDPDSEIHPGFQLLPQDIVVTKRRVSAFAGSDLDMLLRANEIHTLVLAGIATSGVVLSTLRYAADQDYRIVVLHDGCADADEEVHRVLTQKVFPRQAQVVSIQDWVATVQA